jgi:hypothetical protein
VLILGAAAVIAVVVLGGDDSGLSKDDRAYVADVCGAFGAFAQDAQPAINALGDPNNPTGIQGGLDELAGSLTRLHDALAAIDPPNGVATEHEQEVTEVADLSRTMHDLAEAVTGGDLSQLDQIGNAAGDLEQLFPDADNFPPEFAQAIAADPQCQGAGDLFGVSKQDEPYAEARAAEADADPALPGQWVDLVAIYGGPFGPAEPNTNSHVLHDVDYAAQQGLPPAGGYHWGAAACTTDPTDSPPFCGPVPWGIYRDPWRAETLVHNMEHGGVVVWYNTADQSVIDQLEVWARTNGKRRLVVSPYADLPPETIAVTSWSRRDVFAAEPFDGQRLQAFLDAHECRFDPEKLCRRA